MADQEESLSCSTCESEKPVTEFYKNSSRSRGYDYECKKCSKITKKKAYSPKTNKRNKIVKRYGISLEDYNFMFERQNGCCAICNTHQSKLNRSLAVDHCHDSGKVRGLLCVNCNIGIGQFKDSVVFLNGAIAYLTKE
jgi:hypothetical protein